MLESMDRSTRSGRGLSAQVSEWDAGKPSPASLFASTIFTNMTVNEPRNNSFNWLLLSIQFSYQGLLLSFARQKDTAMLRRSSKKGFGRNHKVIAVRRTLDSRHAHSLVLYMARLQIRFVTTFKCLLIQ